MTNINFQYTQKQKVTFLKQISFNKLDDGYFDLEALDQTIQNAIEIFSGRNVTQNNFWINATNDEVVELLVKKSKSILEVDCGHELNKENKRNIQSLFDFFNRKIGLLEIVEIEGKTSVLTSFKMKDSLKKAIPSAKWDKKNKVWTVGPKSLKKLEAWVVQAREDFDIKEIQIAADIFKKKVSESKEIKGHTYDFKEILKEKYQAIFKNGKWLVSADKFDAAQVEIDELNAARKNKASFIQETDIDFNIKTIKNTLTLAIKNIKSDEGYGEYVNRDDDFYEMLVKNGDAFGNLNEIKDYLKNALNAVENIINSVDENFFHSPNDFEEFDGSFNFLIYGLGFDANAILNFFNLSSCNTVRVKIKSSGSTTYCELTIINEAIVKKIFNKKSKDYRSKNVSAFKCSLNTSPDVTHTDSFNPASVKHFDAYSLQMLELYNKLASI